MKTFAVRAEAAISAEELVDDIPREDLVELVKDIDGLIADWDFTLALCKYFAELKIAHDLEVAAEGSK